MTCELALQEEGTSTGSRKKVAESYPNINKREQALSGLRQPMTCELALQEEGTSTGSIKMSLWLLQLTPLAVVPAVIRERALLARGG